MNNTEKKMQRKNGNGGRRNQKQKILALMKILLEETDENHGMTFAEIVESLKRYDVTAERKSIYHDIEALRNFGIDIEGERVNRAYHYRVVNREFELPELKLLVDSVQAARFISEKHSRVLIRKLEGLTSKYEAKQLDRQVCVAGLRKTPNERIYYNVDAIHEAISKGKTIMFQYFIWNTEKKMELKHGGLFYEVSPWMLCYDDEKYYLVGYDHRKEIMKHFRVDKMTNTSILYDCVRRGEEVFSKIDVSKYTTRMFGMFDGEVLPVTFLCENIASNVMIDRFGNSISIIKVDEGHFKCTVDVAVSRMFFGWVLPQEGVTIVSPDRVVEQVRKEIRRLQEQYDPVNDNLKNTNAPL